MLGFFIEIVVFETALGDAGGYFCQRIVKNCFCKKMFYA